MEIFEKIKLKTILYILIFLFLILIGNEIYKASSSKDELNFSEEHINNNENISKEVDFKSSNIFVHISGAVKNPGVIELSSDSRVIDAIKACGGTRDDANLDAINLAVKLKDEDKIYIPTFDETKDIKNYNFKSNDKSISENNSSLININTADIEELKKIPGVGEKTAEKIIEYREKTPFKTIDDIKNIDGIGKKKFDSLKDFINI